MLVIAGTPIGNLKDISQRLKDVLNSCDALFCEDTRKTLALLNHLAISKKVFRYNDHMPSSIKQAMSMLKHGKNICLVTDAGMPCISDPGWKLVREAVNENIPIDVIPGPSSLLCALAGSGLPCDSFQFIGFLPRGEEKIFKKLSKALLTGYPVVFYESPQRIKKFFEAAKQRLPDVYFVLARELTKTYQQWIRGNASKICLELDKVENRGEFTIVAWYEQKNKIARKDEAQKILFVCVGNTCRSVMAERYALKIFPENIKPYSAGIYVSNAQVPDEVFWALKTEGIERFDYTPRQINADMIEESDIILCMTEKHREILTGLFPKYFSKIYQLSFFAGLGRVDISDPWGQDRDFYLMTFKTIKNCVRGALEKAAVKNI